MLKRWFGVCWGNYLSLVLSDICFPEAWANNLKGNGKSTRVGVRWHEFYSCCVINSSTRLNFLVWKKHQGSPKVLSCTSVLWFSSHFSRTGCPVPPSLKPCSRRRGLDGVVGHVEMQECKSSLPSCLGRRKQSEEVVSSPLKYLSPLRL